MISDSQQNLNYTSDIKSVDISAQTSSIKSTMEVSLNLTDNICQDEIGKNSITMIVDYEEPLIPGMTKAKPINHRYYMSKAIEDEIRSTPFNFGYGGFSEAVYYRTYSRLKEDGTKESFPDTIIRVVEGIVSIAKDWRIKHSLEWDQERWDNLSVRFGKAMMKMHFLPPGRGLFISGTDFSYKRGSVAFNNCGFCSLNEGLIKAVTWCQDSLMCGVGVGFSTDNNGEFSNFVVPGCELCRPLRNISEIQTCRCNCQKRVYKIHDSREGWVKSMYLLLESYFNGVITYFDYSDIRLEGTPIKGFGGNSSGPEPLKILHERVRIFIECYIDVNISNFERTLPSTRSLTDEELSIIQHEFRKYDDSYTFGTPIGCIIPLHKKSEDSCVYLNISEDNKLYLDYRHENRIEFIADLPITCGKSLSQNNTVPVRLNAADAIIKMTQRHINLYPESNQIERPSLLYALGELKNMNDELRSQKTYGASRLICDIFNVVAICIIAGNVRRSSEIALGSASDDEFRNLKNYELNPERGIIGWMSNNTVCLDNTEDFEKLPEIATRIKKNGEPGIFNRINVTRSGRIGKREPIGREGERDLACVTEDTLVMTNEGFRRVDELIGKQFTTVINGREYLSTGEGFWCNGIKDVFEVELSSGIKFKLTADHQVVCREKGKKILKSSKKEFNDYEWREIQDTKNHNIVITENEDYQWNGIGTFEEGYFCGQLIGDGTFSEGCPQICLWMKEDVDPTSHQGYVLIEKFARSLKPNSRFKGWRISKVGNGYNKYIISTRSFKKISDKFGIFAREKKVPMFGSYNFNIGFIKGFFDADGTVNITTSVYVRLSQSDIERLESVQKLLLSVGIISKLYKNRRHERMKMMPNGKNGSNEYKCKAQHEIIISGVESWKYYNKIGFFENNKMTKLYNGFDLYKAEPKKIQFEDSINKVTYLGEQAVYDCSIPQTNAFSADGIIMHNCGINPCGEIPLESYEYCNLAEVFPIRCETFEEMMEATYLATIYTSTVSTLPTHWTYSNAVIARNRRIGVSLSGITEQIAKTSVSDFTKKCRALYKIVRKTNRELAFECGILESIRVTTVKPSGTISQLVGCSSGVHYNTHKFCIRRMRMSRSDKLVQILSQAGYQYETDKMGGEGTVVFSFPLYQGGSRVATDVSIWEQANNLALLQREWSDNSVSCTLYFNPTTEASDLEHVLSHFAPIIKSLSALPHCNGIYEQAPYEEITEDEYHAMVASVKQLDFSELTDIAVGVSGCDGDVCTLNLYNADGTSNRVKK